MPVIHLTTFIASKADRVFDLSRSIDLHKKAMSGHKTEAVAGIRTGLINYDETVTWKGRYLGKTRVLKSKIIAFEKPVLFTDEMVEGSFKKIRHEHHFREIENGTIMIDIFDFETPYGLIGRFLNKLFLTAYIRKLLEHNNMMIKDYAETDKWKNVLNR